MVFWYLERSPKRKIWPRSRERLFDPGLKGVTSLFEFSRVCELLDGAESSYVQAEEISSPGVLAARLVSALSRSASNPIRLLMTPALVPGLMQVFFERHHLRRRYCAVHFK